MSFARTERACMLRHHKHVTGSVDCPYQWSPIVGLVFELGTQAMDIDIQGIFLYICSDPPTSLDQLFASSNQPRAPNQSFEQFKLLSRERDLFT